MQGTFIIISIGLNNAEYKNEYNAHVALTFLAVIVNKTTVTADAGHSNMQCKQ